MGRRSSNRRRRRADGRLRAAVLAFVVVGLACSAAVCLVAIDPSPDAIPGVAMGSETILAAERMLVLFAIWIVVLAVVAKASVGELPVEISSRGVRYADGQTAQEEAADSQRTFARLDRDVAALGDGMLRLEKRVDHYADLLRRYAVKGDGDEH